MKRLIVILTFLFIASSFAQYNKFTLNAADDTCYVRNVKAKYFTLVIIEDDSDANIDSLTATCKVAGEDTWYSVAFKDLLDNELYTIAIPGDGERKIYLLNKPNIASIIFDLQSLVGDTEIWVEFINPW